jgi:hypothetical protein
MIEDLVAREGLCELADCNYRTVNREEALKYFQKVWPKYLAEVGPAYERTELKVAGLMKEQAEPKKQ